MNSFFGLGPMELLLIIFIALIVLGPQRLPGTIREVMKYWRYFRNLSSELTSQLGEEFKDMEDLNPQRMLEDLAKELDEEVEQTKTAAGVNKPAKKSTAAKTAAAKSAAAKTSAAQSSPAQSEAQNGAAAASKTGAQESTEPSAGSEPTVAEAQEDAPDVGGAETNEMGADETGLDEAEETPRKSDPTAAQTASAAADAAMAKRGADGQEREGAVADGAPVEDVPADDVQRPAQNGDMPDSARADKLQASVEPGDVTENSILPPDAADTGSTPSSENLPEASVEVSTETAANTPAEASRSEPPATTPAEPKAFDGDGAGVEGAEEEKEEDDEAPPKKTIGSTAPARVSVNGKGARPEDEG